MLPSGAGAWHSLEGGFGSHGCGERQQNQLWQSRAAVGVERYMQGIMKAKESVRNFSSVRGYEREDFTSGWKSASSTEMV